MASANNACNVVSIHKSKSRPATRYNSWQLHLVERGMRNLGPVEIESCQWCSPKAMMIGFRALIYCQWHPCNFSTSQLGSLAFRNIFV